MSQSQLFRPQSVLRQLEPFLFRKASVTNLQSNTLHTQFHHFQASSLSTRQQERWRGSLLRSIRSNWKPSRQPRRCHSSQKGGGARPSPDPTSQLGSPPAKPSLSISERFRKLSREYGWTALGVYLALSALDFPFCFLAVRLAGTQRIAELEQWIVQGFWRVASLPFPGGEDQVRAAFRTIGDKFRDVSTTIGLKKDADPSPPDHANGMILSKASGEVPDGAVTEVEWSWGVDEAEAAHKDHASLATQLALAYAIHKSFIFLRVPLTAAVLPRVVKTLRSWGWNIGKRTPKTPS